MRTRPAALHVGCMANRRRLVQRNSPGPAPTFTERMEVRLRPDQYEAIDRISSALQFTPSELVRLFIDQGTEAVESVATFKSLTGKEPVPWVSEHKR